MTLRDSEASHVPSPVPTFSCSVPSSCRVDGISAGWDHTTQQWSQCLTEHQQEEISTLFLSFPIQTLSLNRYLFIAKTAGAAILFFSTEPTWYPFSAYLSLCPRLLHFPMSPFSLILSFSYLSIRVSSFQLKNIGTDIPSVPPSSCSSFTPSFNNLSSITRFHPSPPLTAFQPRQK